MLGHFTELPLTVPDACDGTVLVSRNLRSTTDSSPKWTCSWLCGLPRPRVPPRSCGLLACLVTLEIGSHVLGHCQSTRRS